MNLTKPWETHNSEKTFLLRKILLYETNAVFFSLFTHSNNMPLHWVMFQQLALSFSSVEVRIKKATSGKLARPSYFETMETKTRSTTAPQNLAFHKSLKKVTEILFLESLTFDLSDSCNLSSLGMCLWTSTATVKLWLESCIISPSS